ncbi:MAG: hypothetical protein H6726_21090 [Sandaracinaceae bacterium]|nr:hypothetical protein [Sandaracinaceae bacterium]
MRLVAFGAVILALACNRGGSSASPTTPAMVLDSADTALTGCRAPGAERLATLALGEQATTQGDHLDNALSIELAALTPDLAARDLRVAVATPAQLDDDSTAELLVFTEPSMTEGAYEARTFGLHFYDCTADGLLPLAPPDDRFADAVSIEVLSGELVRPTVGGPTHTSIRLRITQPTMEYLVVEYLIGRPSAGLTVQRPRGGALGVLERWEIGGQVLVPGSSVDYARTDVLAASGWYPHGPTSAVYLALRASSGPDALPATSAFGALVTGLDGTGANGRDPFEPAWALLGTGPRPTWCDAPATQVRCAVLEDDAYELGFGWIAGTWPDSDAARAATVAADVPLADGTWLYLGAVEEGDSPPPSPTGERDVITSIPLSVVR